MSNKEPYGYISTKQPAQTKDILHTDDGTPYRAVGPSQSTSDGEYQTPVDQMSEEETKKFRRPDQYADLPNPWHEYEW